MKTTPIITHDTPIELQEQLGRTQHSLFINDRLPEGVSMKSEINMEQGKNKKSIETKTKIKAIKMSIDHVITEMQVDDLRSSELKALREKKHRLESLVQILECKLETIG